MTTKNDGGTAFPVHSVYQDCGPDGNIGPVFTETVKYGITVRDYFIAHAPSEPQEWFEPVMPEPPKGPSDRPKTIDITNPSRYISTPETKAWDKSFDDYVSAVKIFEIEKSKQRYVQWPAAWADEMLKARDL